MALPHFKAKMRRELMSVYGHSRAKAENILGKKKRSGIVTFFSSSLIHIVGVHVYPLEILSVSVRPVLRPPIHFPGNYTEAEISFGLQLKILSGKAFRFMQKSKELPIPARSTLQRWIKGFPLQPGWQFNWIF